MSSGIAGRGMARAYERGRARVREIIASRSIAGKFYLPSNSPTKPSPMASANNAEATVSKLPDAAALTAKGNFTERGCVNDQPQHGVEPTNRERAAAGSANTAALRKNLIRALVLVASILLGCSSFASPADGSWLDAVALVESSNNSSAIGDGGRARGLFQFHRDAWEVARSINPEVVEYHRGSTNAVQSRLAAAAYLKWLRQRFAANGIAMPTASQLYAAYNCGFGGFKKRGFDVRRCPQITQRACARIEKILDGASANQKVSCVVVTATAYPAAPSSALAKSLGAKSLKSPTRHDFARHDFAK